MIDNLLALIAPHPCSGCGIYGTLLCNSCKYDITSEPYVACVACGKGIATARGICARCIVPYQRAWCVADRRDQLEKLINTFKFSNGKAAYKPLAHLLDASLPELPPETIIIPVPTVSSHIRQRGYDHTLLVAQRFGKLRKIPVHKNIVRVTNTKQRGENRSTRTKNAKAAFACRGTLDPERTYLLLDDVITTGATVKYAAQTLRDAGAVNIWVASISRQPLD